MAIKIVIVGAGSRSFGPSMINDVLLSDGLCKNGIELVLVDIDSAGLTFAKKTAENNASLLNRTEKQVKIFATEDISKALPNANFVICLVERNRNLYWSQDYHIPRKYGFKQIYGENGGPGGAFHGLRNFPLVVDIAKKMELHCPDATLLNLSNPESRIVDAVSAITSIKVYGFCHGVQMGEKQIADILDKPIDEIHFVAAGINHFSWFLKITDKNTGEDLYPALKEADINKIAPAYEWRRIGLSRILLRRTGLWPTPGTDHCGEYIGWAHEFVDNSLEFIYDPESEPEKTVTQPPEFIYLGFHKATGPDPTERKYIEDEEWKDITGLGASKNTIKPSNEYLIPFIETVCFNKKTRLESIVVPSNGYISNLPNNQSVEVPVIIENKKIYPEKVGELPEFIAAICRLQMSIQKLFLEAYIEKSKAKLIQAILLEPTVTSYKSAIAMINEFLDRQKNVLPEFH